MSNTPNTDYARLEDVTIIRLYREEWVGSGGDWAIDGFGGGKYTEACATFPTKEEALANVEDFRANHGISPHARVMHLGPADFRDRRTHLDRSEGQVNTADIQARLEQLRGAIRAQNISYGELAELADLAEYIDPSDVELLEWAGVPEFPEEPEWEWHVSVIVPVLVRGGTEERALQAAVRHVNDWLHKESDLDADYELTKLIGKAVVSEKLDDDDIDVHLPAEEKS